MVMGVGLRLLRQRQDAEDVCQATFLLLAKKADTMAWRDSVANWLYGVAYRLALKSRQAARRRHVREGKAQPRTPPDPLAEMTVRDLQAVLDEELTRIADKYRAPLVLCCLEGKTRDEAATCLGLPLTTIISRLEAGREALRRRLAKRGIALSLTLAGATLATSTAAAAPAEFVCTTVQAALHIAAGARADSVVSTNVASLVNGGIRAMLLTKLKIGLACGLLLACAGMAVWWAVPHMSAQEAQPPRAQGAQTPPVKQPQVAGRGTLLLARQGRLVTLTAAGKQVAELAAPEGTRPFYNGRLSPDGTQVAHIVTENAPLRPPVAVGEEQQPEIWPYKIVVRKLGADEPSAVIDFPARRLEVLWAANGKRLVVTKETGNYVDANPARETVLLDPKTGKSEPLGLPAGVRVLDGSRDGKTFVVIDRHQKKLRLALASPGDKEVRVLTDLGRRNRVPDYAARLSPDAKQVLFTDADPADKDAARWGLSSKPYVFDIAAKKRYAVADFPVNAEAIGVAWAPDGKRIAYTWMQVHSDLLKKKSLNVDEVAIPTEAFLIVADADGRNARTVSSARGDNAINLILGSIDWR
jgi:RNA polymerase sigma factor (sigma-70 family)